MIFILVEAAGIEPASEDGAPSEALQA